MDWLNIMLENIKQVAGEDLDMTIYENYWETVRKSTLDTELDPYKECLHIGCHLCKWTGIKKDWTSCMHMISCPCKKCSVSF